MAPTRSIPLPIHVSAPRGQRYSCHSCGACCKDFTVQLRNEDLQRLEQQGWERERGEPVTVEFRGQRFLRQRVDGSCTFLQPDGRCEIHARHGLQGKPVACRFFPFSVLPSSDRAIAGLNFACSSVQRNLGAEPASHLTDLRTMASDAPESVTRLARSVPLAGWGSALRPSADGEVECLEREVLRLLGRQELSLPRRLGALAFFSGSLLQARFASVDPDDVVLLLQTLSRAAPDEVTLLPRTDAAPSTWALFRGTVHLRTHSPIVHSLQRDGWWRTTLRDLVHARRWRRGKGEVPRFRALEALTPARVAFPLLSAPASRTAPPEASLIDDLLTRWLQSRILGARAWGPGYYGWSAVEGLGALTVDALAALWLAHLHATVQAAAAAAAASTAADASVLSLDGVGWGLALVERTAGRVPWLNHTAEHLRLSALSRDHGLLGISRALLWDE